MMNEGQPRLKDLGARAPDISMIVPARAGPAAVAPIDRIAPGSTLPAARMVLSRVEGIGRIRLSFMVSAFAVLRETNGKTVAGGQADQQQQRRDLPKELPHVGRVYPSLW